MYNTLRKLSEVNAAQMITIDEHHVCYDGNIEPHVHFYCKNCGKIIDLFDEPAPQVTEGKVIDGNIVQEQQLYYKGHLFSLRQENGEEDELSGTEIRLIRKNKRINSNKIIQYKNFLKH